MAKNRKRIHKVSGTFLRSGWNDRTPDTLGNDLLSTTLLGSAPSTSITPPSSQNSVIDNSVRSQQKNENTFTIYIFRLEKNYILLSQFLKISKSTFRGAEGNWLDP